METFRAVGLTAGQAPTRAMREEWGAFGVVEVGQALVERAAELALHRDLRSLDAGTWPRLSLFPRTISCSSPGVAAFMRPPGLRGCF